MSRGRTTLVVVLILAAIALVAFVIVRRPGGIAGIFGRRDEGLPVDLRKVIPNEWTVTGGAPPQCDYDGDGELEWLIQFQYNTVQLPAQAGQQDPHNVGPWGAAIFDIQSDTLPERPQNPGPYRPTEIIPYKLLPDFYAAKGQGYLGETSIDVYKVPNTPDGAGCRADEINILGYGNDGLPTRISIFRWGTKATGYQVAHLTGNARVVTEPRADAGLPITEVTTYDRIENHRSLLCQAERFARFGQKFTPEPDSRTIDFCYGPPADPFYPEGVVVAVLRKHPPVTTAANVPPMQSYLFDNAEIAEELNLRAVDRIPIQVLRVRNPDSLQPSPAQGTWCAAEQIGGLTAETWWCGRERTAVEADIMLNGQPRRVVFSLASIIPAAVSSDVHWRVEEVRLEQP